MSSVFPDSIYSGQAGFVVHAPPQARVGRTLLLPHHYSALHMAHYRDDQLHTRRQRSVLQVLAILDILHTHPALTAPPVLVQNSSPQNQPVDQATVDSASVVYRTPDSAPDFEPAPVAPRTAERIGLPIGTDRQAQCRLYQGQADIRMLLVLVPYNDPCGAEVQVQAGIVARSHL